MRYNAASYQGLKSELVAGDAEAREIGRRLSLPSSFLEGPRYMRKLYRDDMAAVREYGKPGLFVAFTCQPQGEEVKDKELTNRNPSIRPD